MGASQSTSADSNSTGTSDYVLFEYNCNGYVAEFIHHGQKYCDELNAKIKAYAEVTNIQFSCSQGIITLKANPVSKVN